MLHDFTGEHTAQWESKLREPHIQHRSLGTDKAKPCLDSFLIQSNQQELNKYTDTKQTKSSGSQVARWCFENRTPLNKALQYLVEQGWTIPELAVNLHVYQGYWTGQHVQGIQDFSDTWYVSCNGWLLMKHLPVHRNTTAWQMRSHLKHQLYKKHYKPT